MSKKIALVGGGTGGHIMPILSLVANLEQHREKYSKTMQKRSNSNANREPEGTVRLYGEGGSEDLNSKNEFFHSFVWIGGKDSMEQDKADEAGIRFIPITTYKLTSTRSLGVLLYPFKLLQGIFDARKVLRNEQPKLVFSKGGPGSVAVGIAAWSLRIPLYIHESDTVPGFSNKILGRFATQVFLGFEEARKWFPEHKTTVVGQILHPEFFTKNPTGDIEWKTKKKHIFVTCGSQGSRKIFQTLLDQKQDFPDTEWIISLGTLNRNMRAAFENWKDTQIFDWIPQSDIPHILDGAEMAITRASATTLAELSTRPIHLMIIPLAISAGDHQLHNAQAYQRDGHTVILESDLEQSHIGNMLRSPHLIPHHDTETKILPLLEIF
ncbi:MAG: glycosyltransferase [Candidatus Gracilibacteria bacterium]|nr:glycosyltransferase [Candidatus Gracilibacteria bacterium]